MMKNVPHKQPLVSVIVPNYCHARYLDQRMDSILAQTYRNFEIIVLDDCSTDNSREIIEKYRNNPYVTQIIYNEKNAGNTFVQWQRGIEAAKGELCWIAESDDYSHPTLLERLVEQFSHEGVVLSCCHTFMVDDEGKIFDGIVPCDPPQIMSGSRFIGSYMSPGPFIVNAGMALFSRDVAMSIDPKYREYKGAGDYWFWVEIAEQGKVAVVHESLNFFRRHTGVVTSREDINGNNMRAHKDMYDYLVWQGHLTTAERGLSLAVNRKRALRSRFATDEIRKQILTLWGIKDERGVMLKVKLAKRYWMLRNTSHKRHHPWFALKYTIMKHWLHIPYDTIARRLCQIL